MRTKENITQFSEKCQECFKKWEEKNQDVDNEFIIDDEIKQCLDPTDDAAAIKRDYDALTERMGNALLDPYFSRQRPITPSGRDYGLLFE